MESTRKDRKRGKGVSGIIIGRSARVRGNRMNMEKRKKGNGYEEVKCFITQCLRDRPNPQDPFVRLTGEEIAQAVGISAQSVNEHIRNLVRNGAFHRERRCYFSDPPSAPVGFPAACDTPPDLPATFPQPSGNLPGTFPQPSEKVPVAFSQPSGNLPATFPQPSENLLRRLPEGSEYSKKEYQEKQEKIEKEKIVDHLGDWVNCADENYLKTLRRATALFNKYGAGVRKGTSPALINRFAAGSVLEIPLVNFEELEEQLKQAEQEFLVYESFRGFGRRAGIRRPFVRIANYLKKCFEAAGWTWTKLGSPFEHRLKRAHRQNSETPIFPQMERDLKLRAGSTTSAAFTGERQPPVPTETGPPGASKTNAAAIGQLIEQAGIGKMPLTAAKFITGPKQGPTGN